jgi:hypothetical protein
MIMRKTAESKEAFQGVEEGSQLMVYGKVRKFQRNLVNRNFSDYYLDVEKAVPQSSKTEPAQSQKSDTKPADSGSQAGEGLGSLPKAPKDYGKPR